MITGATGLIGSHAAERLVSDGARVVALCRRSSDTTFLRGLGVEIREGDLRDEAALERACRGVDVVIHAAARLGEWGPWQEFTDLNVTATGALVRLAASAGARRIVHVSSVAVYGRTARQGIAEDTPHVPVGHPYMDTKAAGERVALETARAHGIEVAIVRPCLVYGPRDRNFLPHLIRNLKRGRLTLVGTGQHRANTVFAGTVADLCAVLMVHPRAPFEAFNVSDPDPLTWRELLTAIAVRVGAAPPHRAVPTPIAYAVGGLMEIAAKAIRSPKPPPMTRFVAGALGYDLSYTTAKARGVLGFEPRVTVRDGLERSIVPLRAEAA